ncbi:MAG TPA: DUF6152 family protein [Xanthobacteraceae bacterium]|nr:DUF6152 family protein [Xanthobacteraceae bacterium]
MRLNTIWLATAISVASAIPAFAHHGWGGNVDEVTALSGVVTEGVKLAGPHGTMKIMTADHMVWDITLAPPPRTQSAGLKQDTIPVGSVVTVHGQRNRDPNRLEMKTIQVEYGGKQYNVYPEFLDKIK